MDGSLYITFGVVFSNEPVGPRIIRSGREVQQRSLKQWKLPFHNPFARLLLAKDETKKSNMHESASRIPSYEMHHTVQTSFLNAISQPIFQCVYIFACRIPPCKIYPDRTRSSLNAQPQTSTPNPQPPRGLSRLTHTLHPKRSQPGLSHSAVKSVP